MHTPHIPRDFIPPGYLTSEQFAAIRGISDDTLRSERARGRSPVPWSKLLGWRPVYRRQDVDPWLRREAERARAKAEVLESLAQAAENDAAPESGQ